MSGLAERTIRGMAGADHRWFHPHRGSNLRCRSCGMHAGSDQGLPCPGEIDWPQRHVAAGWYDDLDVPEPGERIVQPAEVRMSRTPHGDYIVTIERWLD